jgi:hypothetical protein
MARKPNPRFFGKKLKGRDGVWENTYVEGELWRGEWSFTTKDPFPEMYAVGKTLEQALERLEEKVLKAFKRMGRIIGYDVED